MPMFSISEVLEFSGFACLGIPNDIVSTILWASTPGKTKIK